MAKTAIHPSTETKDRILAAAGALIVKKGFNGVGINDILSNSDVPKGSFYHWFVSKEQLGVELIRSVGVAISEEESAWFYRSDIMLNHLDRLAAAMEASLLDLLKRGETEVGLMLKLGAEMSSASEPIRKEVVAFLDKQIRMYADFIAKGQEAGVIRSDRSATALAAMVTDLWTGAYLRVLVFRNPEPMRNAIDHIKASLAA